MKMNLADYLRLKSAISDMGYADDIQWAETVGAPTSANAFAAEYIFVVCNSGMKAQIAGAIFDRVMTAIIDGQHPSTVFGHMGKCNGIWQVWRERDKWYADFQAAGDKVTFLEGMPWIGSITKWHLAKNFGVDVVKPDRHLVRVADHYMTTPTALCEQLAQQTGDRIGTVDYVIWRACNLGLLNVKPAVAERGGS